MRAADDVSQGVILAVDLGGRHVGFAISTGKGGIMELTDFTYATIFQLEDKLNQLIAEYGVNVLVVGDMGQEELDVKIQKVLRRVKKKHDSIQVVITPERFSSHQAGKYPKEYAPAKGVTHSLAAVEILRGFKASSVS